MANVVRRRRNPADWATGALVFVHRKFSENRRGDLTESDRAVLNFIVSRTWVWGKSSETIPLRHFTDGVYGPDGKEATPPCGVSRRSVIASIGNLSDCGLIDVSRAKSSVGADLPSVYTPRADTMMRMGGALTKSDAIREHRRIIAVSLMSPHTSEDCAIPMNVSKFCNKSFLRSVHKVVQTEVNRIVTMAEDIRADSAIQRGEKKLWLWRKQRQWDMEDEGTVWKPRRGKPKNWSDFGRLSGRISTCKRFQNTVKSIKNRI